MPVRTAIITIDLTGIPTADEYALTGIDGRPDGPRAPSVMRRDLVGFTGLVCAFAQARDPLDQVTANPLQFGHPHVLIGQGVIELAHGFILKSQPGLQFDQALFDGIIHG